MTNSKRDLRRELLVQREKLSPDEIFNKSRLLCELMIRSIGTMPPSVFLYFPHRSEPDLLCLLDMVPDTSFSLPVVSQIGADMEFYRFDKATPLKRNRWGVSEPIVDDGTAPSMPDASTLIIVPAVALDLRGYRLGYGAGYYDRYLNACPESKTIGVCFAEFVLRELPHDYWDRRLDAICTDQGFTRNSPGFG